ncbi:MAG TPA: transketolase [Candidatus Eisenbacteria bacterium]|nr:transketolase [Candidatus Eisenbacteria bacterium]
MTNPVPVPQLEETAKKIRRRFLGMHFQAKAGHIGSGLSCIDLLTYLYWSHLRPGDRFILSKGHAASALYACLRERGLFSEEEIQRYYRDATTLPAHPAAMAHAEIPVALGSLGHGLPISAGIALGYRIQGEDRRVACLLSDGECDEGSVWEAALFAGHHRLSNLAVLVDANGLQGYGRTDEVLGLEPFADKWKAFGFEVREIDGHDFTAIGRALSSAAGDKPLCVICRTVKGKGVSFMENKLEWHYLPMNEEQYKKALEEQGR